jgi:hypothetical protein
MISDQSSANITLMQAFLDVFEESMKSMAGSTIPHNLILLHNRFFARKVDIGHQKSKIADNRDVYMRKIEKYEQKL